jgi:hypothetical protein
VSVIQPTVTRTPCYDVGVRRATSTGLLLLTAALALAACGSSRQAGPHWPKSAGAIIPDDPADDGGESLAPRRATEQAAAIEHGGDDELLKILDEPAAASPASPAPAATTTEPTPTAGGEIAPEGVPVFEEIIIVD